MKTTSRIIIFTATYSALAMLALFALVACHGGQAPEALRGWIANQPEGVRALVRLALLPVPACMIDMLGRLAASLLFGGKPSVAPRKPAICRIVVIAAHIAAIPLVMALAPTAFPYATAWKNALVTATLFVPLAIAVADMRRAESSR